MHTGLYWSVNMRYQNLDACLCNWHVDPLSRSSCQVQDKGKREKRRDSFEDYRRCYSQLGWPQDWLGRLLLLFFSFSLDLGLGMFDFGFIFPSLLLVFFPSLHSSALFCSHSFLKPIPSSISSRTILTNPLVPLLTRTTSLILLCRH